MYDRDKDNQINKKELLAVLNMMVGENIPEDQLQSIAERTISELDEDGDEVITFEEFCATLEKIDVDEKMSMKFLAWMHFAQINNPDNQIRSDQIESSWDSNC